MPDEQHDETRLFVARKLGELRADMAKLVATLDLVTPVQMGRLASRNRHLLYLAVALLIILIIIVAAHAAYSAGWLAMELAICLTG